MPKIYKNNTRNSCKFKGCSPLQLSRNLPSKCHAVGHIFLYYPLGVIVNAN